jgi:hypothetical protein
LRMTCLGFRVNTGDIAKLLNRTDGGVTDPLASLPQILKLR